MTSRLIIRDGNADDVRFVDELAVRMHTESARSPFALDLSQAKRQFQIFLDGGANTLLLVAEADGRPIGFACGTIATFPYSRTLRFCTRFIFVLPGYRGTPAYPLLLRGLERRAREMGASYLQIGMSGGTNVERLAKFHALLGFRCIGVNLRWQCNSAVLGTEDATGIELVRVHTPFEAVGWLRAALSNSTLPRLSFDTTRAQEAISALMGSGDACIYRIDQHGRAVGAAAAASGTYVTTDANILRLFALYVAPEFRTPQRFSSIVRQIQALALARGADELMAVCTGAERPDMLERALRRKGFQPLGHTFIKQLED